MKKAGIFMLILALCVLLTACGEQKAYDEACALFENGRYAEALEMFRALGDFADSSDRVRIAERRLEQSSNGAEAASAEAYRAGRYTDAIGYIELGRTRDAYYTFSELGDYRDSTEQLSRFTVLPGKLVSEEVRCADAEGEHLRGTAEYSYGADGRAVSRTGYARLDKYGWFEDFNYHYAYNDAGELERIDAVNSSGALSFSVEYEYGENGRLTRELVYSYSAVAGIDGSGAYTEVVESEVYNGKAFPKRSWQYTYCEFGVASVKGEDSCTAYSYGQDGRLMRTVQTMPDGTKFITDYSYADVFVYTPG